MLLPEPVDEASVNVALSVDDSSRTPLAPPWLLCTAGGTAPKRAFSTGVKSAAGDDACISGDFFLLLLDEDDDDDEEMDDLPWKELWNTSTSSASTGLTVGGNDVCSSTGLAVGDPTVGFHVGLWRPVDGLLVGPSCDTGAPVRGVIVGVLSAPSASTVSVVFVVVVVDGTVRWLSGLDCTSLGSLGLTPTAAPRVPVPVPRGNPSFVKPSSGAGASPGRGCGAAALALTAPSSGRYGNDLASCNTVPGAATDAAFFITVATDVMGPLLLDRAGAVAKLCTMDQ